MRKKLHLLLFMLLISGNLSVGKDSNKSKIIKGNHKTTHVGHLKSNSSTERLKRSIDDEDGKPFWANRGKKQSDEIFFDDPQAERKFINNYRTLKDTESKMAKEPPFWGNRGRRDSSSDESLIDYMEYPYLDNIQTKLFGKNCKYCVEPVFESVKQGPVNGNLKERREESLPFWGNRGRRSSEENEINDEENDFSPFWGNRGRREQTKNAFLKTQVQREEEPFWGNRGRREELPFWGNRGRRQKLEALRNWALTDDERFWGTRGRRKDLKDSIRDAIGDVEEKIDKISQLKDDAPDGMSGNMLFWNNKGRDSSLKHLFTGTARSKFEFIQPIKKAAADARNTQSRTVQDDRIFADEPHYILVERSSRSSGEVDPFYISRGKKMKIQKFLLDKAARDRRGAIEDIVKSVKNDPYFIVRGKKLYSQNETENANSSATHDMYDKAKGLICATVDILNAKKRKTKREANEDRGRRALKKLAAQLQIDPYYVSRGKKNSDSKDGVHHLDAFITQLSETCN